MAILKCKMCGGDIQAADNAYGTCASCGSTMTLPKASDEQKVNLFNRANHFRRQNEFDKAITAYENILNLDASSAEAHWGLVLSKYGIEYVEDPVTGRRVPTCHRVQNEPILSDADYLAALENAEDEYTRSLYLDEAKNISEIQKGILAISSKEEPFDVFICYKETTDGGSRTKDSTLAEDIYHQLLKEGYKVFFSRITLEGKLGQQYEPYIFNALNSAKVMLVIGTKQEYFNAAWVKNEWSRFLAIMKNDRSRLLIPCYRDMDAYDLPEEMSMLQSQDMGRIGFIQDIVQAIKKLLGGAKTGAASGLKADYSKVSSAAFSSAGPGVEPMMKRGWLSLEDSEWEQAKSFFDQALNINPEYAPAYVGKLCAELEIESEEYLSCLDEPLDDMPNFKKALRFADAEYCARITGYNDEIKKRNPLHDEKKQQLLQSREKAKAYSACFSAGLYYTVGLKKDGTVVAEGDNREGQCNTSGWSDIAAVSAGDWHTVGVKSDGTVVATGSNVSGRSKIGSWSDIAAVSAGYEHTVGLKADGNVVAVGNEFAGKCNVKDWHNIIAVAAGTHYTLGLKTDGTVVAVGDNEKGQCNTGAWRNIVAISAGASFAVGLKTDGKVVATGDNNYGQCDTGGWRDIISVSAGASHTVGLKADGTVVAVGNNGDGQCDICGWSDIMAISAGSSHTVGLKADGTFVVAWNHDYGRRSLDKWRDFGIKKGE